MKYFYRVILIILLLSISLYSIKKYRNYVEVGLKKSPSTALNNQNIVLRVTDHKDQGNSQFCWVFSSIAILESMFLEKHTSVDAKDINLSPWYFKESNGSEQNEGTIIDALNFHSKKLGFVSSSDYSRSDNGKVLETTFLNKVMSPTELRKELIGDHKFWAYAISSKLSGWHPNPDPSALPGTKAFFIPRIDINDIVRKSLIQKVPVGYWFNTHVVVIYGAQYDSNGIAIKYYIKDSYAPYFYEKAASWVHENIIVLTSLANLNK
jgi:hypothetical protein